MGITLEKRIYTVRQLEDHYGFTEKQQQHHRTKLSMPYCKVANDYFYNGTDIDKWIMSFKVDHKEKMIEESKIKGK